MCVRPWQHFTYVRTQNLNRSTNRCTSQCSITVCTYLLFDSPIACLVVCFMKKNTEYATSWQNRTVPYRRVMEKRSYERQLPCPEYVEFVLQYVLYCAVQSDRQIYTHRLTDWLTSSYYSESITWTLLWPQCMPISFRTRWGMTSILIIESTKKGRHL